MRSNRLLAAPLIAAFALLAACGQTGDGSGSGGDGGVPRPAAPIARVAPPAGTEWTDQVVKTDRGGYLKGNPQAAVKVVEYGALSCSHCAAFSESAKGKFDDYVKSGRVSWEFRPFLLGSTDVAPTLLNACQGPGPFFTLAEQVYADQPNWLGKLQSLSQEDIARLQSTPPAQQPKALATVSGLDAFYRQRGLPQAKIDACLADGQAAQALADQTKRAVDEDKVSGTPTFFLNGTLLEKVAEWSTLEPRIKAALGE